MTCALHTVSVLYIIFSDIFKMGSHVINYAFFQLEHQLSLACILSDSHKFQSLNRKSHCHGLVIGYHNQLGIDQNCRQLSISSLECSTIDRLFLFIDADSATINFHKLASLQVKASSNRYTLSIYVLLKI